VKIFARTTRQGTAAPETALCESCLCMDWVKERILQNPVSDIAPENLWGDCTDNPELECAECGATAATTTHVVYMKCVVKDATNQESAQNLIEDIFNRGLDSLELAQKDAADMGDDEDPAAGMSCDDWGFVGDPREA